jgi:hypothetical protein
MADSSYTLPKATALNADLLFSHFFHAKEQSNLNEAHVHSCSDEGILLSH